MVVGNGLEEERTDLRRRALHGLPRPDVPELHAAFRDPHVVHDGVLHLLAVDDAELVDEVLCVIADLAGQERPVFLGVVKVHADKGVGVGRVEEPEAADCLRLVPDAEGLPDVVEVREEAPVLVPDLGGGALLEGPDELGSAGIQLLRRLRSRNPEHHTSDERE